LLRFGKATPGDCFGVEAVESLGKPQKHFLRQILHIGRSIGLARLAEKPP
jgi:hypothetical protein